MRLIDAYTAISLIQEDKIEGETLDIIKALGDGLQAETLNQACDRHIKIIKSLPTVAVESTKHGQWIPGKEISREFLAGNVIHVDYLNYRCSVCGAVVSERETMMYHFCPHCGARMDGGKNDRT